MYNTTGFDRAQRTGCMMFSYALRELNVMVASNDPLQLDHGRLKAVLENYSIDGHPDFRSIQSDTSSAFGGNYGYG